MLSPYSSGFPISHSILFPNKTTSSTTTTLFMQKIVFLCVFRTLPLIDNKQPLQILSSRCFFFFLATKYISSEIFTCTIVFNHRPWMSLCLYVCMQVCVCVYICMLFAFLHKISLVSFQFSQKFSITTNHRIFLFIDLVEFRCRYPRYFRELFIASRSQLSHQQFQDFAPIPPHFSAIYINQ